MSDASRRHLRRRTSDRRARFYEALEHRLMFVVFPVTGTAGDDVITLSVTAGNVVANVNGTPSAMPDTLATSVTINAQAGNDTILIHSNGTNPVTVNAGAGTDVVRIAPTSQNLDNIDADVTVNGDADADNVSLFDANHATGLTYAFSTGNSMRRAGGPTYTFNTVELAELDGASGNDFYSFTAMPTLPLSLTDNGGGGTIQINGNGTENILYEPDAVAGSVGSLDLGAHEVAFADMTNIFCSDLNNIAMITPNAQDTIAITQTANLLNNRVAGTSGGVSFTPLHFNTIDIALQMDVGLHDDGAAGVNAVTLTGDLIGAPRVELNGAFNGDVSTNTLTVNDGSWTINLNVLLNRKLWTAALNGAGTDVTFAADEGFRRLEVNSGATAHLSGIGNDAAEFAVASGTGTVDVATGGLFEAFSRFDIGAGDRLRKTGAGRMFVGPAATQVHGAGSVVEADAGIFDLTSDAGSPSSRTLSIDSNALVRLGSTQHLAGVFADIAGTVRMEPNGGRVLVVSEVAVNGEGGQIDLTDNDMILDYTGPTQIDTVFNLIRGGFVNGAWNGIGIVTSTGQTNPSRALGYAEATDLFTTFPATFAGQPVDNTAVLVKHTFFGDHDLNGNVNLNDFNRLAANFGQANRRWIHGDNDYNRTINLVDFNKLAANFGASGLSPDAGAGAQTNPRGSIARELFGDVEE